VEFGVSVEALGEATLLKVDVLDARTLRSLCNGYSYGVRNGLANVEADVELWHSTPVLLVLDIAHGPVDEIRVRPEVGAVVEHAWGVLHLVAAVEGESRSWGTSSDRNGTTHNIRFDPDIDRAKTVFAFLGIPRANPVPVEFQFLGREGKRLQGAGGGSSGGLKIVSAQARRDEVAHLLARRYTQFKRLIISLPEIPGLPEDNGAVQNLFDVLIPHLLVRRQDDLQKILGKVVQMDVTTGSMASPPPLSFPRFYTNATARDLLADLKRLHIKGTVLEVDPENHVIRTEPPAWRRWLARIKALF
jgi:hypothetical protein